MRFFNFGSINKNLAFLVILAALPALLILFYSEVEQRRDSIETARNSVTLLAHSMSEVQRDITGSARQILSTLALLPEVKAANIESCSDIFRAVIKQNPDYKNIVMTDLKGNVLASALPFSKTTLADRKHVIEALQRKDFSVGEYIITRVGRTAPALPFAYPVLDDMNNPVVVLTTTIDLSLFAKLYDAASLPENSFISTTDNHGIRIFYYPPKEGTNPIGQTINASSWKFASQEQDHGIFMGHGSDGENRVIAYEKLRLSPDHPPYIYVWAGIPETYILQSANSRLIRNLLFMLLVTTIALFISRLIGKKTLVTPIKNLVRVTENFAKGNFSTQDKQIEEPGELGTLTRAFYEMVDNLSTSQKILQDNELRFRTVMDSLDALVYVADMQTYEILFINEYGRNLFGDIQGKTCWRSLQKDQTGPCSFCTNKQLLDGDNPKEVTYAWDFQNTATASWYHISDRAIKWVDGRIVRLEVATDISERILAEERHKVLEDQLRKKFKMEAVGVMAGGIAHNFNNSLAVILGNIEVSKLKLPRDSVAIPFLDNAKKAITGSTELVRQILTYSHQWKSEKAPVQLSEVLNDTLKLLKPTIPSSIRLHHIRGNDRDGFTINADPSQIQDVLINLCNNAVYAMDEKGDLTISLDEINLQQQDIPPQSDRAPGSYVKLSIHDTGSGMSGETIEKIFDPFFTTKEAYEGTGMGLSTVQGVMDQHDGLIKVRSTLEQGTVFDLYFPVSESQQVETRPTEQAPVRGTERILFLDDELVLASTWSQVLAEYGYRVTTETNSQKALQTFRSNPAAFDLVITDQTMPELTGKEIIKEILGIRQDIPTILCTGYSHSINEENALELGVKAFCMKPITLHELLKTVRRVLDKT